MSTPWLVIPNGDHVSALFGEARLLRRVKQLEEALRAIQRDAGTHTVAIGDPSRGWSGFGYIYDVATAALLAKPSEAA